MSEPGPQPPANPPGHPPSEPPSRFLVRLEPAGWCFEAEADRPLTVSARAAGIVLPASCRNGTCRTCLCRVALGSVGYRIDWPGLLAEEKAEGWILPCVAHPASDLVVEQPRASRLG